MMLGMRALLAAEQTPAPFARLDRFFFRLIIWFLLLSIAECYVMLV